MQYLHCCTLHTTTSRQDNGLWERISLKKKNIIFYMNNSYDIFLNQKIMHLFL